MPEFIATGVYGKGVKTKHGWQFLGGKREELNIEAEHRLDAVIKVCKQWQALGHKVALREMGGHHDRPDLPDRPLGLHGEELAAIAKAGVSFDIDIPDGEVFNLRI